jgi:hypothetical protein
MTTNDKIELVLKSKMATNDMIDMLENACNELYADFERVKRVFMKKEIQLPINEIDGVKCIAHIILVHKGFICFEIASLAVFESNETLENRNLFQKTLLPHKGCAENPYTRDDFIWTLVLLKKTLSSLSFDRYTGQFTEKKTKSRSQIISNFLIGINNINRNVDTCCVCLCDTITQTPCGHHLCVPCWDSVKRVVVDGDYETPCPMCRAGIEYANIIED